MTSPISLTRPQPFHPFAGVQAMLAGVVRPIQFGCTTADLASFNDVFQRRELTKYANQCVVDDRGTRLAKTLAEKYDYLQPTMKTEVDRIFDEQKLSPGEINGYYRQGKMGIVEECADLMFEYGMYRAAREGIIGEAQLLSMTQEMDRLQQRQKSEPGFDGYQAQLAYVKSAIKPEQYAAFAKMLPFESREAADELFATACFKQAQWALKAHQKTQEPDILMKNTRDFFEGEVKEFVDVFEGNPLIQWFLKKYMRYMIPLEPLLGDKLFKVPVALAKYKLDVDQLPVDKLVQYVVTKQRGRHELDNNTTIKYDSRKLVLKPFEALVEASILKELGA